MEFRTGNKAIRDHVKVGKTLYLFEQERKGNVRYISEFVLFSYAYRDDQDKHGQSRRNIIFHMKPVRTKIDDPQENPREMSQEIFKLSAAYLKALRREAYAAAS